MHQIRLIQRTVRSRSSQKQQTVPWLKPMKEQTAVPLIELIRFSATEFETKVAQNIFRADDLMTINLGTIMTDRCSRYILIGLVE